MSSDKKKCEVIDINSILRHKGARYQEDLQLDLNGLIVKALQIERDAPRFSKGITVVNKMEVEAIFEAGMLEALKKRNLISSEFYLCATYVAGLLSDMLAKPFDRIVAFDAIKTYADTQDSAVLKRVADSCFLLVSVFPGASLGRSMSSEYYREMGIGFYHSFYGVTQKEIGWHMSQHFNQLSEMATECVLSLKETDL